MSAPGAPVGPAAESAQSGAAEQARSLERGAVDSLPAGELQRKCEQAAGENRPLRVKLGIDPTAPDIHLGHAVVLRKLRAFQELGHRVVLIIGDYTARVGDPSGRSTLRPLLSEQEIAANAQSFQTQASHVLSGDPELLEVRFNSEWLEMPLSSLLELLKTTTVAQLIEREDFARRLRSGQPLSMLELLYPLLQAYDSVAVAADLELGGTDQKFNLLLGRDVQRAFGKPEQAIMTMPILPGTDGHQKMSKSLGNHIAIVDQPAEIYGRLLSIPDAILPLFSELLLDAQLPAELAPRDAKHFLARAIVAWLHGPHAAAQAAESFQRQVVEKRPPEEIPEVPISAADDQVHLPALIAGSMPISRSQARRLIDQGGVSLDGEPVRAYDLPPDRLDGRLLQVGKRRYLRPRLDPAPS